MRRNSLSSSSSFETTERLDERQSIARLLTPSSAEAQAALYASENGVEDLESRLDETILAQCASYRAFERYLSREHLIILPRTRRDLESVLRRYSTTEIHNWVAKSRSPMEPGGYGRVVALASDSIQAVLESGDNLAYLLGLHVDEKT